MNIGMVKNMSNSSLVTYTKKSPNYSTVKDKKNTHIVIHHMAGKLTVQQCGNIFANASRQASSNYGVCGSEIGLYVDENKRSWATSSREIDSKAVTIETSNSTLSPKWEVSDETLKTLINLCADICKRNGIKKLNYTGNKTGNLHLHKWYSATSCPGAYLESKMPYIAEQVNKKLTTKKFSTSKKCSYKVTANKLNMRKGASTKYDIIETLHKGDIVLGTGYYYPNHYQIKHDGKTGWVSRKYLTKI